MDDEFHWQEEKGYIQIRVNWFIAEFNTYTLNGFMVRFKNIHLN